MHRTAATLLCLAALALAPLPAHAGGTATVTGYGAFNPGQTALPTQQHVPFDVAGQAVTTTAAGPVACRFDLVEEPSSLASGTAIRGSVSCTGAVNDSSSACTSQRNGMHLTVACTTATGSISGSFHFMPRSVNPTNDYDVAGQLAFA